MRTSYQMENINKEIEIIKENSRNSKKYSTKIQNSSRGSTPHLNWLKKETMSFNIGELMSN